MLSVESFKDNDEKTKYFTALDSWIHLKSIYDKIKGRRQKGVIQISDLYNDNYESMREKLDDIVSLIESFKNTTKKFIVHAILITETWLKK